MPKMTNTIRIKLRAKTIDVPPSIYKYLLARQAIRTRPRKAPERPQTG